MLADLLPDAVGARVQLRRNRDLERRIEAFNFLPTRIDGARITLARMAPNDVVLIGSEKARKEPVSRNDREAITVLD